ncbi:hypothetical protein, partial [Yanshouia hominis]|uniref:hypothetical protein n=1 Tax=Yanshouia hominis TaxID=2763673 RepID=UPI0021CCC095
PFALNAVGKPALSLAKGGFLVSKDFLFHQHSWWFIFAEATLFADIVAVFLMRTMYRLNVCAVKTFHGGYQTSRHCGTPYKHAYEVFCFLRFRRTCSNKQDLETAQVFPKYVSGYSHGFQDY